MAEPPTPATKTLPGTGETLRVDRARDDAGISEDTSNLEAPDAEVLVERMLELVAAEGEALLATDDDRRLADLNVRTALASWDALDQWDEAMRFVELADSHPLTPRIRIAAALSSSDPEALLAAQRHLEEGEDDVAIDLAEAWLWKASRPDRSAAIADRLLGGGQLTAAWRAHVIELATVAHAAAGHWDRVVALRMSQSDDVTPPAEVAVTAAMLLDRLADAPGALRLCSHKLASFRNADVEALGWLRTLDVAIAAATAIEAPSRAELVEQRRGVVEALPAREIDLADKWRAVEIAAATSDPSFSDLASSLASSARTVAAERWLDVHDVANPTRATLRRFEARGGLYLRWAALLAERLSPRDQHAKQAIELWTRAGELPDRLATTDDHLVRLHRGHDVDHLAEAYARCARSDPDPRCAAALWCARGIVDLARGDFIEAEASLRQAADLGPDDPFSRAALAAVFRAGRRYDHLAQILAQLSTTLTSPEARATATREYAELLDEHLGDPSGARASLERMIVERPQDLDSIRSLARMFDRDQQWGRALELRRRATELASTSDELADLWLDIAHGEEARGDVDAAIAAYDEAARTRHPEALREVTRLHRTAGRYDKALAVARAALATDPPIERRVQLQVEIASLLTTLGRDPAGVVAAYLDILAVEPDQTEALAKIEAPARALGMWDELARAFRGAPRTARNLEVLAEALTRVEEWSELADVRRRQLEASTSPPDKLERARALAQLYERELGDPDAAIRTLSAVQAVVPVGSPDGDALQRDVLRLLRQAERWADVARSLERELSIPTSETEHQVAILRELGEIKQRLGRPTEAIQAYEGVLERLEGDPAAAAALEKLYEQSGKDRELARMLEARAEAAGDPADRARLFARVAALRGNRGDVDGALAAYTAAFAADPTNRDVFTSMEVVCYKAERWAAAMQLYETAIAHVEGGGSRAYRLGDLYARRGNVQLNYLGQLDAAIDSYQKVVEVDSQPDAAVEILEALCRQREDWQPLITAFERRATTQRDPKRRADALRNAARLAAEHGGNHRDSVRLHKKLLALEPMDDAAAASLVQFFEQNQDNTGLVDVLKLRLEQVQDKEQSVELLKRIARVSEENARDVETATVHYQKVLEIEPTNREALDALARIHESMEQWSEFIEVTRRLIKVTNDRPTKALLYFRCGSVMEAKFGREQDAIRYYDAAIKASSACLPAVHGLRDLYRRREDWPRVIETLELEVKLWQDDKERAGVFAQIGKILEQHLGDDERALEYYDSALAVDPDCLPANQALFEHYFAQQDWERAQPIATALAQRAMRDGDPTTRSAFYRKRGIVARMAGEPRAAAESFIVALEIKPTSAEALDELCALARERPDAWDFETTYRELEKLYKKREDAAPLLARVYVGRAAILERAGDLDAAAELYTLAHDLTPNDFTILSAVVDFHVDMRRWRHAVAALDRYATNATTAPADRTSARMRKAAILGDGERHAEGAIAVLRQVIESEPTYQDAYYELAQQYFLLGRYDEARLAIEQVIDLASGPQQPLSPEALARYYYYKGRIVDAIGDARAAASQYRRASEYDPGYAPPALVLARRAAEAGDVRGAETLLIDAAHAAMESVGPAGAVPLQRGLARILLASGERQAAIEAYRGILAVEVNSAADRVALAEIYSLEDPEKAIAELRKVIDRDIHHAPAYRLLASFHERLGETERATRVMTALKFLGFAEPEDRHTAERLLHAARPRPMRRGLDGAAREQHLLTAAARSGLGALFSAFSPQLSSLVSAPFLGENLAPAVSVDPRVAEIVTELGYLFQTDAEVFVGERVPGGAVVTDRPQRLVVLDRALLDESAATLRFVLGYALEAIRGGYAMLLQLGARQHRELATWLRALLAADVQTGPVADLINQAPPEAIQILEQHAGTRDVDAGAWIDGMLACAKRAGLVACDDFGASIRGVARMSGERLASDDQTYALGAVLGGPDLVRFYLSDDYQQLRDVVTDS